MTLHEAAIRILHVGPEAGSRGGLGTSIRRLLNSPLAQTYTIEALATWRPDTGPARRLLIFLAALCRLAWWCVQPGRRIVHVHAATRGSWYRKCACVLLVRLLRRPVVLQLRVGAGDIATFDEGLGVARRAAFRFSLKSADRVLSVSRAGAAELERRYGLPPIAVVPNPPPEPVASESLREFQRDPGQIVYLGGFRDPAKGADILMQALPAICGHPRVTHVLLAGPGQPPGSISALIADAPAARWLGWLDEDAKQRILAESAIFVLPSRSEGMPNALLEAMAHGLAIVAARVGEIPHMLTDDLNALLVPPEDAGALAAAVGALLDDDALRRKLGGAARARLGDMSGEETWSRLDAVYRELAAAVA